MDIDYICVKGYIVPFTKREEAIKAYKLIQKKNDTFWNEYKHCKAEYLMSHQVIASCSSTTACNKCIFSKRFILPQRDVEHYLKLAIRRLR